MFCFALVLDKVFAGPIVCCCSFALALFVVLLLFGFEQLGVKSLWTSRIVYRVWLVVSVFSPSSKVLGQFLGAFGSLLIAAALCLCIVSGFFLGFCDFGRGCPSDLVVDSVDRSFLSYLQKTLWAVVLGSVLSLCVFLLTKGYVTAEFHCPVAGL
ncbi:hypothetical protein Tco_0972586 [Tanacetum coccineum]